MRSSAVAVPMLGAGVEARVAVDPYRGVATRR